MSSETPAANGIRRRSKAAPIILGAIAVALLVVALLGLPIVPLPTRSSHTHEFATFGTQMARWRVHSGYRYTADSWLYWGAMTGCLFGLVQWWRPLRGFTKIYVLIGLPAAVVLALGPVLQAAVGLQSSNYSDDVTFGDRPAANALAIAIIFIVVYALEQGRRVFRRWVGRR